jgi:hypothetical protein
MPFILSLTPVTTSHQMPQNHELTLQSSPALRIAKAKRDIATHLPHAFGLYLIQNLFHRET